MSQSRENKIKCFDRYIIRGGDMTLDEIETSIKETLDITDVPLKPDVFDDFITLVIEKLTEHKIKADTND